MLRTVLFDLGNVILYFSHERMYEQIGALCGLTGGEIQDLFQQHRVIAEFECGRMNRADFHRLVQSWTETPVDRRRLLRACANIFTLNESIVPVLDQIKAEGLRLVLLSNTNIAHIKFIEQNFDVLSRFDELVLSYEVGAMKPDPPIYEAALDAIQCEPVECFYTDDLAENVERARRYGLQAEVFIDTQNLISQLERRRLYLK